MVTPRRRVLILGWIVVVMLALNVALGLALLGQGVARLLADVAMSTGERLGATASFAVLTVVAGVLLGRPVRRLPRRGEPR